MIRAGQAAEGRTAPKGKKGDAKAHGKAASPASGQDAEATFRIDGRFERTRLSAREKVNELRKKLGAIQFTECQGDLTVFSGEALDEFRKDLRAKTQTAASVKGDAKTIVIRLEKGASAEI